jgi:hypothetical protein
VERLAPEKERTFRPVRGLLSPSERTIYLSPNISARQAPWIIYRETGHGNIEWHRDLLYLDTLYTLSPAVRKIMEREANEFAGHLQFLGHHFADAAREVPFGLTSVKTLADRYEASYESTIRRYVETQERECFCQAFEIANAAGNARILEYRYFIKPRSSNGFWQPNQPIGTVLRLDDSVVRLLNEGKLENLTVYYDTRYDEGSRTAYHEQVFSNTYQVFVLTTTL